MDMACVKPMRCAASMSGGWTFHQLGVVFGRMGPAHPEFCLWVNVKLL